MIWTFWRISSKQACEFHQVWPTPCCHSLPNIDCPTLPVRNAEQGIVWGHGSIKENKVAKIWILPLHIQGTILHQQTVLTIFIMSFCPLYPDCENCCVQCHQLLRNTVPTANALDQHLLALLWMDQFIFKACSILQAMHQMLEVVKVRSRTLSTLVAEYLIWGFMRWW